MLLPDKDYTPPKTPTCVILSDSIEHNPIGNSKANAGMYYSSSNKFNREHLTAEQRKQLGRDFKLDPSFNEIGLPTKRKNDGIITMQMRKKINTPDSIMSRQSWAEYPADFYLLMFNPMMPADCLKQHMKQLHDIAWSIKNFHPETPFALVTCTDEEYESDPQADADSRRLSTRDCVRFAKELGAAKHVEINPETWSRESGKQTSLQKLYDEMFKETLKQFKNRPKRHKALEREAAKAAKRAGTAKEKYTPPHTQGYMSGNLYASQRPQDEHKPAEVDLVIK